MYHPATRLLTLLDLLQSRGEVSGRDLAAALEVEERSVRRYVMMLRDMGIPIDGERGRHGGYSVRPGFRLPPLMFNANEITAVMLGLLLMREHGLTAPPGVESATAKIERVLPAEHRQTTDALRAALVLDVVTARPDTVSTEWIIGFSTAAHERRCLDIAYLNFTGDVSERRIAPYGVVLHAAHWYVPAYDMRRDDVRVFRLDRVQAFALCDAVVARPASVDARQIVIDTLIRMPGAHAFEVILHAPLRTAQASVPDSLALLAPDGDDTLMRCYSDDAEWMARMLVQVALPFTVREDDALREALRRLADELVAGTQVR